MFCELCQTSKLRREFPLGTLTASCDHAPLHCLRCVTNSVRTRNRCSQCDEHVTTDNPCYRSCVETLERLFPEYPVPLTTDAVEGPPEDTETDQTISVVMLGGEGTVLAYRPDIKIASLKSFLQDRLGPAPEKQRLLYNEQELKSYTETRLATLQDYGVQPFATVHLIVLLYAIPDSFDHVIFDLHWGYPRRGRDYLDASVLLYSGQDCQEIVDYEDQTYGKALYHSGDVMNDRMRRGHHRIDVKLKKLPPWIDKLFFTLSAWNSPNISKYRNPSLRFFDAREPNKQLCSDEMQHAAHSQAIIMCSLSKVDGAWKVFSLRTLSAGNAKNYSPLQQTISRIISQGLC